jgi:Paraquat-inducible protein A
MRNVTLPRILLVLLFIPIIGFAGWCGLNIYKLSEQRAEIKHDFSELNNITYGLLSVDAWRDHITEIVIEKIQTFNFSPDQEAALKTEIDAVLNAMITQADVMINEKQTRVDKKIKKFVVKSLVNMDKIRKRVPEFSQAIINELKKPQNKEKLTFLAKEKLADFAKETHDSLSSRSNLNIILAKYHVDNTQSFNDEVKTLISTLQDRTYTMAYMMLGCLALTLAIWFMSRKQYELHTPLFVLSVVMALMVLIVGLSTPMIEIDARIKELNFVLIGKHLVFHDQVLFFQSKSILDVVHIMMSTGKGDSMAVGFLILVFSVLFPITKLVCTKIYLLGNERWRTSKFLNFFVFKSGKWSMADVMVVAIFMSYIGFKGILDSQLGAMNMKTDSLATIATNDTSLQPGFILFVCYVFFSLILGEILKWITTRKPAPVELTEPVPVKTGKVNMVEGAVG